MRFKGIFALALIAIMLSGCFTINYYQKFERDGTSVVTQELDMSALTNLQNTADQYGSGNLFNYTAPTVTPNENYSVEVYESYATPDSMDLTVITSAQSKLSPSGSAFFEVTVSNNGQNAIRDVEVKIESTAFVPSVASSMDFPEFLGTIQPDDFTSGNLYLRVASVEAGSYPATTIVSFSDDDGNEYEVGQTDEFTVIAPTPSPSPSPTPTADEQYSKVCDNAPADVTCTYADGLLTLTKRVTPSEAKYEFNVIEGFPYIRYEATIPYLPSFNTSLPSTGGVTMEAEDQSLANRLDDPESSSAATMMKGLNAEMNYEIEMPGKITKAEGGIIDNNIARFDVLELMSNKKIIRVESEEPNIPYVAGAVILILILLAILYQFVLKRKPTTSPAPMPTAPQISAGGSFPPQQPN